MLGTEAWIARAPFSPSGRKNAFPVHRKTLCLTHSSRFGILRTLRILIGRQKERKVKRMSTTSQKTIPLSLDPKTIRPYLRTLIRRQDHLHSRETPRHTHTVIHEIWQLVAFACQQLQDDEHQQQALMTLQAVTDVYTTQWMSLNDIHGEASDFFEELASVWTEALLRVDLTTKERTRWSKRFTTWQARLADTSLGTVFDAPQAALREGWDHLSLQCILQGISQESAWEGEIPAYAPLLTHARLTVLAQRKQFQEYLSLAKAEGQTKAYVTMLVQQGQIAEAISYGRQHLATAEDAFAVAQALCTHGEQASGLQIATHGLTLEGNHVPLATWLRDQSCLMGKQIQALEAGTIAFRSEPTLEQYLRMAHSAGTQWPEQRAKLLDSARHAPWTADPQEVLRIFLHEHLFDDAIAVLKTNTRYTLVALVVDAALEEQVVLEWVTQACRQQAEHIINGAKASYYQAAATWLTKARAAYHLRGQDEAWHIYLHDLLNRHRYKSKLLPLLMALEGK